MMRNTHCIVLLGIFLLLATTCLAADNPSSRPIAYSRLVIDTDEAHYVATFDPRRISEQRLKKLLAFSPHDFLVDVLRVGREEIVIGSESSPGCLAKGPVPDSLELCIVGDPRYARCGKRNISDPNFFKNAQTNVDGNDRKIAALNTILVPKKLEIIDEQYRDELVFYSELLRRQLEYLKTGNSQRLVGSIGNVDPSSVCKEIAGDAAEVPSAERRYEVSRQWHKCVNAAWRKSLKPYPREDWNGFLNSYGITEKFDLKPMD